MCLVPVILIVGFIPASGAWWYVTSAICAALFIGASVTDMLDGKIARKNNLVTDFGKFMDPVADKFMVIGAMFVLLYRFNNLTLPLMLSLIVIVFRELAVTSMRLVASSGKGVVLAANYLGKLKTVSQIVAISTIFLEPVLQYVIKLVVEAVTGEKAEAMVYGTQDLIAQLGEMLGNSQLVPAIKRLVENNESLAKEVEAMQKEQLNALTEKIVEGTTEENGYFVVARQLNHSADFVKNLAYNLRTRKSNLVMVVGSVVAGKATLTIMLGDDVVAKGVDAGAVVREAAKLIQGGGGGQKFFATAGGKNLDGIVAAIDKAKELIFAALQ